MAGLRVLIIGSGGREHALAWRLAGEPEVDAVVVAPGNPLIAGIARVVPEVAARAHRVDEQRRRHVLQHDAARPQPHGFRQLLIISHRRQQDDPRARRERLERWAAILEAQEGRHLVALRRVEFLPEDERAVLRADNSPIALAQQDPMLFAEGLTGDRLGEAMKFFDLSYQEAHYLLRDCHFHGSMTASNVASRVRAIARRLIPETRAFRADALRTLDLSDVESKGYCFQVDMAWRAVQAGLRVVEVPITFVERVRGESKMDQAIVQEALKLVTLWGLKKRRNDLGRLFGRSTNKF